MPDFTEQILAAVAKKGYQPLKPKALARKLGVPSSQYGDFSRALRELVKQGRAQLGKNHAVQPAPAHGAVAGIYRRTSSGLGFVRPHVIDGRAGPDIRIPEDEGLDAAT